MAKIKFDIKYRPEIESGKYKVVERSTNRECTFLSKDDLVIVYFNGIAYVFDYEKSIFRCQMGYGEFDILTDELELTEFEEAYLRSKHHVGPDDILPEFLSINNVRENAQKLLDVARNQLQPEIDAEIDKAYKNSDAVQYRRGKEDALKDMPHWKHMYAGAAGNGDGKNIYLIRDGIDSYRFSPVIAGGEDYLVLAELNKLPSVD